MPHKTHSSLTAKITLNTEIDEYRVRLFIDGVYQAGGDYFTDCKEDAQLTAAHMCKHGKPTSGRGLMCECEEEEYQLFVEGQTSEKNVVADNVAEPADNHERIDYAVTAGSVYYDFELGHPRPILLGGLSSCEYPGKIVSVVQSYKDDEYVLSISLRADCIADLFRSVALISHHCGYVQGWLCGQQKETL
tara:strand:+ start:295 stop:864 length:570 start_codon:yes stop_codon:yes gene_type:complete